MLRALSCSLLVLFLSAQACEGAHSCTAIGCIDQVSFQIETSDGTWPDGAYTLELTAGSASYTCSMNLPHDLPVPGGNTTIPCQPPVGYTGVYLRTDMTCTEHRDQNSVSQTCTPIPGHYTLVGSVPGTPSTLGVRVTRDEVLLLEQTLPLTYSTSRPNGPDCEPVCRQASVEVVLP